MADPVVTPDPNAAGTPPAPPSPPWHQGKLDAELIGHAQNAGWKLDDPAELATSALKAHREAQKFIGVPPDQLLRLPKDATDEAAWKNVWSRLGVPKESSGYDLSAVKFADGTALDDGFAERIRNTAFSKNIPAAAASAFAQEVVNFMQEADKAEQTEREAAWQRAQAALKTDWGPNFDRNSAIAAKGAEAFGLTQDDINALKDHPSYPKLITSFLKVGMMNQEPGYVDASGRSPNQGIMSQEQAIARHEEIKRDAEFQKRLLNADPRAMRELEDVIRFKIGYHERAA